MLQLDLDILFFFNRTLAALWLDPIMIYVTNVGHWVPFYLLAGIFLIWKYKWKGVRMVVAVIVLAGVADLLTNRILKEIIARPRPCSLISDPSGLYSWIRTPDGIRNGFGFPSSHAVNNFAGVMFFIFLFPKNRKLFWLLVPAMIPPISRMYLGLHYPSDIVGGIMIGSAIGWGFAIIYHKFERKFYQ
jgi:undecaprenyl-diphosphatase